MLSKFDTLIVAICSKINFVCLYILATIEQVRPISNGIETVNPNPISAIQHSQNLDSSYFNYAPSTTPSSSAHHVPLGHDITGTQTGHQEMLGNVPTIMTNYETLFVNEYRDSTDRNFSIGDFENDVCEEDDSDELLSAVSIICENRNNENIKSEEDLSSQQSEFQQEVDLFPYNALDTGDFGCFYLPNLVNDDVQCDTLDHWLSLLQSSESRSQTPIREDQVHDDSLFDMSLMNDDTFFQHCKFLDQIEDMIYSTK